ncbi:hypothetical protein [uncultured Kordia sp.]|uniref:hypothetical protein n=1 Tax=uncultured Kordia sp. TaxID=507699 RepID=UPI002612AD38|nr:hypothetical protein [uncultured Kordia sp.]
MEILIFQTDIKSVEKVAMLEPVFNNHADILSWSVDLEDIDKVLRIEANACLTETAVIELGKAHDCTIEVLAD